MRRDLQPGQGKKRVKGLELGTQGGLRLPRVLAGCTKGGFLKPKVEAGGRAESHKKVTFLHFYGRKRRKNYDFLDEESGGVSGGLLSHPKVAQQGRHYCLSWCQTYPSK